MAFLTRELLNDLGIKLTDEESALLSDQMETTLHDRVIDEVVAGMSPAQAKELAEMQLSANNQQIYEWLQRNVDDLGEIVSDEVDILLGEIAENGDAFSSERE